MNGRTVAAALGSGITAVLVVAVAVIELVAVEFSALVGLPVALGAGIALGVAVAARYESVDPAVRHAADAIAGFGLVVGAALAASYGNLAGVRSALSTDVIVGLGGLGAALAALASWRTGANGP